MIEGYRRYAASSHARSVSGVTGGTTAWGYFYTVLGTAYERCPERISEQVRKYPTLPASTTLSEPSHRRTGSSRSGETTPSIGRSSLRRDVAELIRTSPSHITPQQRQYSELKEIKLPVRRQGTLSQADIRRLLCPGREGRYVTTWVRLWLSAARLPTVYPGAAAAGTSRRLVYLSPADCTDSNRNVSFGIAE